MIVYSPPGAWIHDADVEYVACCQNDDLLETLLKLAVRRSSYGLVNNSDSYTDTLHAYISFSFYANAIYCFGNRDNFHGYYTITLNGELPTVVSGYAGNYNLTTGSVCLYYRGGLALDYQQTIVINQTTVLPPNQMEFDAFMYVPFFAPPPLKWVVHVELGQLGVCVHDISILTDPAMNQPGINGISTTSAATAARSTAASGTSCGSPGNVGGIAEGFGGGVIVTLAALALFFYCRRRSRRAKDVEDGSAGRPIIADGVAVQHEPMVDTHTSTPPILPPHPVSWAHEPMVDTHTHTHTSTPPILPVSWVSSYTTMPNAASTSLRARASNHMDGHDPGGPGAEAAAVGGAAVASFAPHNYEPFIAPLPDLSGGGASAYGRRSRSDGASTAAATYHSASDEETRQPTSYEQESGPISNFFVMGAPADTFTSAYAENAQVVRAQAVAPTMPDQGAAGPSRKPTISH